IASKVCADEILHAVRNNKRLFPIVRRDATNFEEGSVAHEKIKQHNWLMFREQDDFETAFKTLIETISLDLEHLHSHTRLLVRAIEWGKGRSDSLLLRGDDLANAERWLAQSVAKEPQPTELQETYIKNSRDVEDASNRAISILKDAERKAQSRIKTGAIILAGALILALAVSLWAKSSIDEADKKTKDANKAVAKADITLDKTNAEIDFLRGRDFEALLNAMRAYYKLRKAETALGNLLDVKRSDILLILLKMIYENPAINILEGHSDTLVSAQFSEDGSKIFTISKDNTAKIWNLKGQVLKIINKHVDSPSQTQFNKQGDRLITTSKNKVLKILDIEDNIIKEVKDIEHAQFSDDYSNIIAYPNSNKQSVLALDLQGNLIHEFKLPEDFDNRYFKANFDATKLIYSTKNSTVQILDYQNNVVLEIPDASYAYFNEDSSKVIVYSSASYNKEKHRIFDLQSDRQPLELKSEEIRDLALNRDGSKILTLTTASQKDDTQKVKLSNFKDNQINETLLEFRVENIIGNDFSEDYTKIILRSNDNKIQIWDLKGDYIEGVKYELDKYPVFNRDHSKFINRDGNNVRLLDTSSKSVTIQGNNFDIRNFSRDGNRILTSNKDQQTVQLFDLQGNPIGEPLKAKSDDENAYINNDFKKIVIVDDKAKRRRIFDFSGKLNADIEGIATTFNKDGSRIATRLANKILLWDAQGNRMGTEIDTGLNESEWKSMNFSSDGTKLIVIAEKKLQIWDLESR
ncbi:MAG: WD40 repeat domain-containing protein, partial [Pseudanabaena sp. ELA607]